MSQLRNLLKSILNLQFIDEPIIAYIQLIISEPHPFADFVDDLLPLLQDLSPSATQETCTEFVQQLNKEKLVQISDEAEVRPNRTLSTPIQMESGPVKKEGFQIYNIERVDQGQIFRNDDNVVSLEEFMQGTYSDDPRQRISTLRTICPCRVKKDVDEFWSRIISMVNDPDPEVRYQVLHNLCDGSPNSKEFEIIEAIEKMHYDPDNRVRRKVNQVLSSYERSGKWNIL
eukprot:TRINITY_DN7878_c0_g1_i1.p1 TRINITY_DN7878_c0_g1~~TRINITY_DN7878_c0_g1_i1.p1  ORF type:complete len:246 (+),score=40.27 TRINITY_DN7878_c0_g1_i1:54-740(+)